MYTSSGRHLTPMAGGTSLGVTLFAGLLLLLVGAFHLLVAFAAVAGNDGVFVQRLGYAYQMDLTVWGWIHVATGAAAVLIGLGVMAGRSWAQVLGLCVVFLSALDSFAFLPNAPIWSVLLIAFDALVMWALIRELGDG